MKISNITIVKNKHGSIYYESTNRNAYGFICFKKFG